MQLPHDGTLLRIFIGEEILIFILDLLGKALVGDRFFPIRPEHRVCFSGPGLSIRKNGAIEPIYHLQNGVFTQVIHVRLTPILSDNFIVPAFDQVHPV